MLLLTLASEGVDLYLMHDNGCDELIIDYRTDKELESIKEIITTFYYEFNAEKSALQTAVNSSCQPAQKFVVTSSALFSVSMFALLLCTIHAASVFHNNHREIILKYGSSALYVLQGEYYRVVSALLLHSDVEHLAANVAGVLLLATPLCSITGSVTGMALIILSGGVGNFINALLYRSAHLSIGASTAVMGAVGSLVAFQIINRNRAVQPINKYKKISPIFILGCGAAFVGIMSGGKDTDVSAHIFGFLSGLVFGFPVILTIYHSHITS
ncbi:MAG: rhomboid family intramembrane serine protease [Desulfamplus sp.]